VDQLPAEEARAILKSIHEENWNFYRDRRGMGALKDLQQTFPNPWLYIAELLQNAVDERATRIEVTIHEDGSVVFEHNGNTFSVPDVGALCTRGVSAKGANTVGFMGIGFKSVFRSFEKVQISSLSWRFVLSVPIKQGEEYGDQQREWLGAVLPYWDTSADAPSTGMKCRFVLMNRLPDLPPPAQDLERVLGESETLLALLAWQGVKELKWNGKSWLLERDESPLGEDGDSRVLLESLDGEGNSCRRWILFSKSYQPSRQAIARFLEHRQLSPTPEEREKVYRDASRKRKVGVFCEIDNSDNPIPLDRGSAFALLPTSVTFPLGLHVQADWLLVVTRREIIQIEGNQWHEEILEQLPRLVRYYLEWLVAHHKGSGSAWYRGYDALPSSPLRDVVSDQWFGGHKFLDALRQDLGDVAFLPKPPDRDGAVIFLTPKRGRFLPKPFVKEFEDTQSHPHVLFGDRIISSRLLGVRARQCLERLQLIQELAAADLVAHWDTGVVKRWLTLFAEDVGDKMLLGILQALVELDDREEWRNAELVCIPTASNDCVPRRAVSRYPADWNILAQEDGIRHALEPFLGTPERIVSWDFDSTLQRTQSPARSYLDNVPRPKLEEVVNKWWEYMPASPSEEHVGLIVRFSTWVLEKQPQRKGLIGKLLCLDLGGELWLRPNDETLLTEPYAGGFRRLFFPASPGVAPVYESQSSTASRADWRAFFEKLDPPPSGRFSLALRVQMMSYYELTTYVAETYRPPACRVTSRRTEWRGFKVQSDCYTVIDACLPPALADLLQGAVTEEQFSAISQWLAESPTQLCEYDSVVAAYIPYGSSWVSTERLPKKAQWVVTLSNAPWVYTTTGEGPFRPRDVLPSGDPARPDAPVAKLPAELVEALQRCGTEFGSALPDAPAIDRLRIQGPAAPADQLLEFVQAAIAELGDDENKRDFLCRALRERSLFPMPAGRVGVDGAVRVPHSRIIWSDRGRSVLGNWLIPIDSFTEGTPERSVLELTDSFLPVPKTTTLVQVLDFLSWVWSRTPDADLVRRLLPRAYGYVKEDLEIDSTLSARWNEALPKARVFVQGKRRWVLVSEADTLFLDDLNADALGNVLPSVDLATPGHFGDNPSDQIAIARLLGIRLLSSRFCVAVEHQGGQTVPAHWQLGFQAIQDWLRGQLKNEDEVDTQLEEKGVPPQNLKLSRWKMLRTVIYDSGTPVQTNQVRAAPSRDGSIAVSGSPDEFAEELCKVLFSQWGLRLRRDLVDLIPRVAIRLTRIDDAAVVTAWLSGERQADSGQPSPPTEEQKPGVPATPQKPELAKEGDQPMDTAGGVTRPNAPAPEETAPEEHKATQVTLGGSYTEDDREARIRGLIEKKNELERKIRDALTTDISPVGEPEEGKAKASEFRTDEPYRQAALKYEGHNHRYPNPKGDKQAGHDIDSYTHPEGHPDRRLIRRIEVKGRSRLWDLNEIVEMSDTQFKDALNLTVPDGEQIDSDFDYWLYVVERQENGELKVLPMRNVARRAARFGLKGGSWRNQAEPDHSDSGCVDEQPAP
jgi:hypothetical protein